MKYICEKTQLENATDFLKRFYTIVHLLQIIDEEIDLRSLICIDGNFVTLHTKTSSNKKWGLHQVLLINQLKASGVDITTFTAVNSDPENISGLQSICKNKVHVGNIVLILNFYHNEIKEVYSCYPFLEEKLGTQRS